MKGSKEKRKVKRVIDKENSIKDYGKKGIVNDKKIFSVKKMP